MQKNCEICNKENLYLENHHIIPKSRGGSDSIGNLISICSDCHGKAHNVSFSEGRTGLVKEGIEKSKSSLEDGQRWLNNPLNEKLVNDKLSEIYFEDPDKHNAILYLMSIDKLQSYHLKDLVEKGQMKFKGSFTIK